MQDRYVGDIGDFGKLILLRDLCKAVGSNAKLGVNWYHVDQSESTNDGRHIEYLNPKNSNVEKFRQCDPVVHEKLSEVLALGDRSIKALEQGGLLPVNTTFYSDSLPCEDPLVDRRRHREAWFEGSLNQLRHSTILFLDPDNGIQTPNVRKTQKPAVKYAFDDEIQKCFEMCAILVVYNHKNRVPNAEYVQGFIRLRDVLNGAQLRILRFKRFSVRDYLLFFRENQKPAVEVALQMLTGPPKNFLFSELQYQLLFR